VSNSIYSELAAQDAQTYGVPTNLFLAQIQQESSFNPDPSGGVSGGGIAQIQPATANNPGYGLSSVNPLDPTAALAFAAQYDAALYQANGDNWVTALQKYGTLPTSGGTASQQALAQMAAADTTNSGSTSDSPSNVLTDYTDSTLAQDTTAGTQAASAVGTAAQAVSNPLGTLASFLGVNISAYDIGIIFIGALLVIGSIFFISKPAIQSVTVQAASARQLASKAKAAFL
jgi:hypothetical protein